MPCYMPHDAWYAKRLNDTGKRPIVFNVKQGYKDMYLQVPCGNCIGCRLDRSRQWAVRCVHEASLHDTNSFITLTYNDENYPAHGNLYLRDFQLFMKRLRKRIGIKVRYYACGEYGEKCFTCGNHVTKCRCKPYKPVLGRPHFHAIIFGYDFPDKVLVNVKNGNNLYFSPELEKVWPYGFNVIGNVTFESAAYVARYVMKKQKILQDYIGDDGLYHYERLDKETGETHVLNPEFTTMSRGRGDNKGIGYLWYKKYGDEAHRHDFVVINGSRISVPRYYDNQLADADLLEVKLRRKKEAVKRKDDNTRERIRIKEAVKKAQLGILIRNSEDL